MSLRCQRTVEHEMSVKQSSQRVGDRFIGIVSLDQHGIERRDRSVAGTPGPLDQSRQLVEDTGGITARRGRFPSGQTEFSLGERESGDTVEQQQDVMALLPKRLRDRGRGPGRSDPLCRRPIARRDHNDRPPQPRLAETAGDEFLDLAAPLPDHADHNSIGGRAPREHPQQRTLADARAGKDTDPLTESAGQHCIDGADAGL